jgi:hypothetical protein
VPVFSLILSSCHVHGRGRPVWSCGVVDWFGRPLNEQSVAWSDSWSQDTPTNEATPTPQHDFHNYTTIEQCGRFASDRISSATI